jgi:ABC-type Fe3+ transport system permease subunit
MTTLSDSRAIGWIGIGLVALIVLMLAAPLLGVVLPVGWLMWAITRTPAERAAHRRRLEASHQRAQTLIADYMTTHGLPDTPINREVALQALCRPARRRSKR